MSVSDPVRLRPSLAAVAAAGLIVAMVGTYWDDAWHTDRGRDEFAIAPHLMLYAGVAVSLGVVGAWAFTAVRKSGWAGPWQDPALRLAIVGAAATIGSAPIDEWWHQSFGRDAVLWSPPHLVGVFGMLALAAGLLAGTAGDQSRVGKASGLVLAAAVIGVLQVPVLEYDSDVPQFAVFWYLPVSIVGACVSFWLVDRLAGGRWTRTWAAAVATLLRLGVIAFLALADFSSTTVPPLIVGAAMFDLTARRGLGFRLWSSALAMTGGWWVAIAVQPTTATPVSSVQVVVIAVVTATGAAIASQTGRRRSPLAAPLVAIAICGAVAGVTSTPAWAHDPGQGDIARSVRVEARRDGAVAQIRVETEEPCDAFRPGRTVARRAGATRVGPLVAASEGSTCRMDGEVAGLDAGAWFVYAELDGPAGQKLETWVHLSDGESIGEMRDLYEPVIPPDRNGQWAAGAVLLAMIAALFTATVRLSGTVARTRSVPVAP
jgi:hypothetical protein